MSEGETSACTFPAGGPMQALFWNPQLTCPTQVVHWLPAGGKASPQEQLDGDLYRPDGPGQAQRSCHGGEGGQEACLLPLLEREAVLHEVSLICAMHLKMGWLFLQFPPVFRQLQSSYCQCANDRLTTPSEFKGRYKNVQSWAVPIFLSSGSAGARFPSGRTLLWVS